MSPKQERSESECTIDISLAPFVVARSTCDEAIQSSFAEFAARLDCFASLATTADSVSFNYALHRHHDLAEVLVGVHALERGADFGEGVDLVDRQFQRTGFYRRPDLGAHRGKDVADFLH